MPLRLLILFLLVTSVSKAQPDRQDTTFLFIARENAKKSYNQLITGQSQLYRGSDYHLYKSTQGEYPYYLTDDWQSGSIIYDGERYENVPLLLDIYLNKVIIENFGSNNEMELINEKIDRFRVAGHTFIHLKKSKSTSIAEGFYDLRYDGKIKFYVKHEKSLQKKIRSGKIYNYFEERSLFFILKNGFYFPVKSKKSVLNLLYEREHDLKQFLSKNKIQFSNREYAITKMVEFYDTPIKP